MSRYLNISGTLTEGVSRVRVTNPALSYDDAEVVDRDLSKFDVVAIGAIIFLFFGFVFSLFPTLGGLLLVLVAIGFTIWSAVIWKRIQTATRSTPLTRGAALTLAEDTTKLSVSGALVPADERRIAYLFWRAAETDDLVSSNSHFVNAVAKILQGARDSVDSAAQRRAEEALVEANERIDGVDPTPYNQEEPVTYETPPAPPRAPQSAMQTQETPTQPNASAARSF